MVYEDTPLEGVDIVVSEKGDLGRPTGETAWCFDCDCMMVEVTWKHTEQTEWLCFSILNELGEGLWQINQNSYG